MHPIIFIYNQLSRCSTLSLIPLFMSVNKLLQVPLIQCLVLLIFFSNLYTLLQPLRWLNPHPSQSLPSPVFSSAVFSSLIHWNRLMSLFCSYVRLSSAFSVFFTVSSLFSPRQLSFRLIPVYVFVCLRLSSEA